MKKMNIMLISITIVAVFLIAIILIFVRGEYQFTKKSVLNDTIINEQNESENIISKTDNGWIQTGLSDREYVISLMGEPKGYIWGEETFNVDDLPSYYIMDYGNGNMACIYNGILSETRVHYPGDFTEFNGIRLGDTIEDVIEKIGKPNRIAEGEELNFEENVLFLNYSTSEMGVSSDTSNSYYSVPEKNIRMFFNNNKVNALYNTGGFTPEFLSAFSQYIMSR